MSSFRLKLHHPSLFLLCILELKDYFVLSMLYGAFLKLGLFSIPYTKFPSLFFHVILLHDHFIKFYYLTFNVDLFTALPQILIFYCMILKYNHIFLAKISLLSIYFSISLCGKCGQGLHLSHSPKQHCFWHVLSILFIMVISIVLLYLCMESMHGCGIGIT